MAKRYVLKNVRPIGFPGHDGSAIADVAVEDGKVAASGGGAAEMVAEVAEIRDFGGAYLSPAWVDMHTHVFWGGCDIALPPAEIGAAAGAPILVDAGSAGEACFHGFREFVMKPARERILPFLNVGSIGLVATNRIPEVRFLDDIDPGRIIRTVEENAGRIAGLKVRLLPNVAGAPDVLPLKMAKKLSRVLRLPVMVHYGQGLPLAEDILDLLDEGDILTHCFQGNPGFGISDDDRSLDAARNALARGVALDVGHGAGSFAYRVARRCMDAGVLPTTVGSDIHDWNVNGPVWDLSVVMSKMLAVGLSAEQVIAGVTAAPRRLLRLPEARLEAGAAAEFTVFTREASGLDLPDACGESARIAERFLPKAVVWKGELTEAASRYGRPRLTARHVEIAHGENGR